MHFLETFPVYIFRDFFAHFMETFLVYIFRDFFVHVFGDFSCARF